MKYKNAGKMKRQMMGWIKSRAGNVQNIKREPYTFKEKETIYNVDYGYPNNQTEGKELLRIKAANGVKYKLCRSEIVDDYLSVGLYDYMVTEISEQVTRRVRYNLYQGVLVNKSKKKKIMSWQYEQANENAINKIKAELDNEKTKILDPRQNWEDIEIQWTVDCIAAQEFPNNNGSFWTFN